MNCHDGNKLIFLEQKDPEINYMFMTFPDPVMRNEEYCECLQYMGTVLFTNGDIKHQFRHRAIPGTNERKYWNIQPSANFMARVRKGEIDFSKGF